MSIPLALLGSGKSAKNGDARQVLAGASVPPAGMAQLQECEQVRELPARRGVCAISDFTRAGLGWSTDSPLTDLPASLRYEVDCTVPNMKFLHLRSQANTQDI